MDKEKINERRIKLNEEEIKKSGQRRFRYRIIQYSIAAAALFSSACAYASYRMAPADGALFFSGSEALADNSDISYDEDLMLPNGRYITVDSVHKEYSTDAYDIDSGDVYHNVRVDLPTIVRGTDSNHMLINDNINIGNNMYVKARTVPTEANVVKCQSIISTSLITEALSHTLFKNMIDDALSYEESLKFKNRKLRKPLR